MRTERSQQCYLAHPRSNAWPGRPDGIPGQYSTDRQLVMEGIPGHSWEFLATGTGVTGLTVAVQDGLRLQVNHAGAYDDAGIQRPVVLHLDWADQPTTRLETCVMSHDLQRSLITLRMETPQGALRAEIRAHMALDVIRVDLFDERAEPQPLAMIVERTHPHQDEVQDGAYLSWHTNANSIYSEGQRRLRIRDGGRRLFARSIFWPGFAHGRGGGHDLDARPSGGRGFGPPHSVDRGRCYPGGRDRVEGRRAVAAGGGS